MKKEEEDKKKEEQCCSLKDLFHFADTRDKVLLVIGAVSAYVNGMVYPAFTIIFGDMSNSFRPTNTGDQIVDLAFKNAIYFLIVGAIAWLLSFIMFSSFMVSATRQTIKLRTSYFHCLLSQDIAWHDTMNPTTISSKISNDAIQIQNGIGEKCATLIMFISMFINGIGVGFIYGWNMSLVLLAGLPFLGVGAIIMIWAVTTGSVRVNEINQEGGGLAEENISNIKTLKSLTAETFSFNRYKDVVLKSKVMIEKYGLLVSIGLGSTFFFMFLDYALAFYYGAKLVGDQAYNDNTGENYKVGDVMTIFFSILIGGFALGQASPSLKAITQARVSMHNYLQVAAQNPTIILDDPSKVKVTSLQGEVELQNVVFSYPNRDHKVLNDVSIRFLKNKKNALVAESGQGKSTVMQLLERFYDCQEGFVMYDGQDIKQLNLKSLRQHIGYVSQEPVLFATSIRENLKYGKEDATESEMVAALKDANAWEFVEKTEHKLDTFVGVGGGQFSGGQKQRIAIARALLKNPSILLLDEATSALDKNNEQLIQQALDRLSQNRTTITIAHRLTSIMDSDIIFVIDNGKVVQQGVHSQLIEQEGKYKSLAHLQNKAEELQEQNFEMDSQILKEAEILMKETMSKNNQNMNEEVRLNTNVKGGEKKILGNGVKNQVVDEQQVSQKQLSSVALEGEQELSEEEKKKLKEVDEKTKKLINSRMGEYQKGVRWMFWLGVLCSMGYGACMPLVGNLLAQFIAQLANPADKDFKAKSDAIVFKIIGVAFGVLIGQGLGYYFLHIVGQVVSDNLRQDAMQAILVQPVGFFDLKQNNPGQLTTQLTQDCQQINSIAGQLYGVMYQVLSAYVVGMILAFMASWRVTLVALACTPLMIIQGMIEAQMTQGFSEKTDGLFKEAGKVVTETMGNIRTVASFGNQAYIQSLYDNQIKGPLKVCSKNGIKAGMAFGFSQTNVFVVYAVVFYTGALFVKDRHITMQNMFDALFSIMFAAFAAGQAAMYIPDVSATYVAARSIIQLIDLPSESTVAGPAEPKQLDLREFKGHIEFKDIWFRYPNRPNYVLRGLNMVVEPGEKVAMVGPSGCGKSTVMSLLMRFYEPSKGQILLDGEDIKHYSHVDLRKVFGVVSQEPVMFNGSVQFNVLFNSGASQEQMLQAVRQANAYDFIVNDEFELQEEEDNQQQAKKQQEGKGFMRTVGAKGSKISGGQKQRLAIARAILKYPRVLLLDEATSALDQANEQQVQKSLDQIMQGKTTLSIAHRISTIKNSATIYMMNDGKVVEQGTYQQLQQNQSYFYKFENGAL